MCVCACVGGGGWVGGWVGVGHSVCVGGGCVCVCVCVGGCVLCLCLFIVFCHHAHLDPEI